MGVAIENANAITKTYAEQQEAFGKVMKQNALRVSQIDSINYSLTYLVASSMGGARVSEAGAAQPFDVAVTMNIDIQEFPKIKATVEQQASEGVDGGVVQEQKQITGVKFAMPREKFLQFTKEMKGALSMMEQVGKRAQDL